MRRLSLAGEELSKGNAKIIEIAMKMDTTKLDSAKGSVIDFVR